ncbi:hypothetical protein K435DRAFT_683821 [Dendrothele bispora CBS 962.96]|uniref:Uncharacterized protein n=1 Tax=Dendrothele bispora (strain CBS 962.96) TaxID=1314807 RepID=A0A4S8LCE1_DENBC|nr:hypothetical protein K435DRAFT_683821 [Dendrothele bispora CBS 962.96]
MLILQAWSWLTFYSLLATAVLVNKTIDDTYGDGQGNFIQYLPVGAWNNGPECNGCSAKPDDKSKVYSESWHDGDFSTNPDHTFANQILTATAMFNGSAIYVFCVLAKTIPSILDGDSDMTFYIDGVQVGTFVQSGDDTPTSYQYQVPVYQNEALTPGLHNFTLANGHINGTESLVLLDRIVYTYVVSFCSFTVICATSFDRF